LFADAGQVPQVVSNLIGGNFPNSFDNVLLSGYMLDCTVAPCAAIAQ